MVEWLYSLSVKKGNVAKGFLLTYIGSTFLNAIPAGSSQPWKDFISHFDPKNSWSLHFVCIAMICLAIIMIAEVVLKRIMDNRSIPHTLSGEMLQHSADTLEYVKELTGYSWGYDKVLYMAKDIFCGWKPEDIVIDQVIATKFSFSDSKSEMNEGYQEYCKTADYENIVSKGNNSPRWMLANAQPNFSKTDKKIFLTLRETDWSLTSYVWNYFRNNMDKLQEAVKDAYGGNGALYPNSLCMHLVIVTDDNKVILTKIANTKRNDYPTKWAATIGEQLEQEDFTDGSNINKQFIRKWIQRAFSEEFGIEEQEYHTIVDDGSIAVLSINMEADIYNFSLMTVVQLHQKYDNFQEYLRKTIVKDKEFIFMEGLPIKKIPQLMAQYKTLEEMNEVFHPSTFLRLFMCYIHYYGVNHFAESYQKAKNEKRRSG